MKIEVITSFNDQYYEKIGKDCVNSWLLYWPLELSLTCYVEDFKLDDHKRINQISFNQLPVEYFKFQTDIKNRRIKTFSKKAYSVIHAMQNSTADRIIWLDADVISKKFISMSLLTSLCNDDTLATFMGVEHDGFFSAETGFFIVNKNHPGFLEFSNRYTERYNNRISHDLRRFYDGEVFGATVKEFSKKYKFADLSASLQKPHKSPMKHTVLGSYMSHFKSKHSKEDFSKS